MAEVLVLPMKEGPAAFHLFTVMAVLPDLGAPKTRSLVYTELFPDGVTVLGKSEDIIIKWYAAISAAQPVDEEVEAE